MGLFEWWKKRKERKKTFSSTTGMHPSIVDYMGLDDYPDKWKTPEEKVRRSSPVPRDDKGRGTIPGRKHRADTSSSTDLDSAILGAAIYSSMDSHHSHSDSYDSGGYDGGGCDCGCDGGGGD